MINIKVRKSKYVKRNNRFLESSFFKTDVWYVFLLKTVLRLKLIWSTHIPLCILYELIFDCYLLLFDS